MISETPPVRKRYVLAAALVVAAAAFLVYLPSLQNGFVNWDDNRYVYENASIRSFDLRYIFTGIVVSNWHPLTMLSLAADHYFWGLDAAGYHLTNAALHALNTLLVFVLALRLSSRGSTKKAFYAAAVAGLLFGLHPIHVESVTWVSERKDVLYSFFYILSVILYLSYAKRSSRRALFFLLALISFILSLMSKPMAVSLPLVLLILDYYPLGRLSLGGLGVDKRVYAEKIPFFLLSVFSAIATIWAQRAGEAVVPIEALSIVRRIDVVVRGFAFYIYKILLPSGLAPFYPKPPAEDVLNTVFWLSLLFFLAASAISVYAARKKERIFIASWLYYVITLLPVIGIVQVGAQAAADRYAYLPGLAVFLLAGAFTGRFIERYGKKALAVSLAFWVPVLLVLSYKTVRQERVWKDSVTLWTYEIELYPDQVLLAYMNRGAAYGRQGDLMNAYSDFTRAIEMRPNKPDGYHMRALVYSLLGMRGKAIEDLTRAIELDPELVDAYNRRGMEYASMGEYRLAIEDFKMVAALEPGLGKAYANMGLAYLESGDAEKAKESFDRARALGVGETRSYLR